MNNRFKHLSHFVNKISKLENEVIIHMFMIRSTKPNIEDFLQHSHQKGFGK
jgi:hypothetical protein